MTCRLQEACCPVNGEEIVQITNMDLIQLLPSMEHPHWNSSSSSSSSCTSNSAKDTTTNTTTTCPKSQQTMASSRNEFSSNQSDRRQRSKQQQPSYCLKKGGGGGGALLRITFTTIAVLCALELLSIELQRHGVEAAVLRQPVRRSIAGNIWERPCGDGWYNDKSVGHKRIDSKRRKIKDVWLHADKIMNTLAQKERESHWLDGDWEQSLPDDFEFPDISHFTFRKAHSALQQYMAIFDQFITLERERRGVLRGTFERMQSETRSLLCLIESVINGTNTNAKRMRNGGLSDGAAALLGTKSPRTPAYRYYTQHVMQRKLKGLTDVLTEETILPIAKVVFLKFKDFVRVVSEKAVNRMGKKKSLRNAVAMAVAGNGGGGQHHLNEVTARRNESVQKTVNVAVAAAETKKAAHQRKNKNRPNKSNGMKEQRKNKNKDRVGGGNGGGRRGLKRNRGQQQQQQQREERRV